MLNLNCIALQFTRNSDLVTDVILNLVGIVDLLDVVAGYKHRYCSTLYALHSAIGMLILGAFRAALRVGNITSPLASHGREDEDRQHPRES